MSNLKQIGLGVMMYVQDYNENYPYGARDAPDETPPVWTAYTCVWHWVIHPYIKSNQIYRCPSSPYQGRYLHGGNYGANDLLMPRTTAASPKPPVSLAAVNSAASIYMIMDTGSYFVTASQVRNPATYYYFPGTAALTTPTSPINSDVVDDFNKGRHFLGVNTCFADGHVKWLSSATVFQEAKKQQFSNKNAFDPQNAPD